MNNNINRRSMLGLSLLGGAALATLQKPTWARSRASGSNDSPEMKSAVASGVNYFYTLCDKQLKLCEKLESALSSGNLKKSQEAYINSRPPYEEIETLAYAFEDTDRDIDARPYAFEQGETDSNFKGFHKIEAILFGYQTVREAIPYSKDLTSSIRTLKKELTELDRFDSEGQFGGMYALTNEVASKKISSEEEAWSDQTLLIFKHNWKGVYSQFEPFYPLVKKRNEMKAKNVKLAYEDAMKTLKPYFNKNTIAAKPYSQVSMTSRRKMADASNRIRDAIAEASKVINADSSIS